MDAEIIESLINDNLDDFYFSSQLESDLLKSSTLNLEQTSLKAVNYRSYYLHFLLGSILSLPSFPKLMDKLRIEDIFLKWHISQTSGSENGKDYVLKLAITMKKQNNERAIVYRSFSFDPKLSSMFESSEVSDNDVKDLVLALRNKDRKIDDYSFDDIFHHAIVKPENDRPYRIRQEFNVIMENSKAFKFLDTFQTLSSANSPVRIFELPQMFVNMRQKLEEYKTARYDIQTDHFVDVISHSKLGDLDHIYSTEDMVTFLDRVAELYQIYDKVFKMKFSSSRIDHCAFLHGILLINMKNRYNLQINVENGEIMNYDTIQMVLKSSSKNIHDSAAILEKPLVLEFQDQGGETGALNIISKIRRIGYVKLLPQIQTLAKECTFFAVNFISPFARVKMIQIPLRKLQPDSSNSILELIRKAARDLFSVEQRGRDNDLILKEDIMKEFLWKIRNFVETIQSGNILYRVPDDVRYLSRYIVGEAATSNLPTYVVDYSDYEMDYFDCITTFVVCTESTDYDIILNIFEGPKSMSNVNMDFLLKKSNSKLAKRLQIDLRLFPRHELNEFQYSTDFQMKDFIDKLITIHEFYDISGDKTGSAPLVRIPEVRNLQISHLSPEHPSIPNMVSRLTKNFLYIMRDTISDEKNLEAMFRGILHKHNIVSISDNFPDQRSLISADEHSKLIRLRFFVSNGKSQRLLQRTAALKIHQNHVHKTYSIIFNKDTESVRDTVAVVHDRGSQTKNLQKYVAECKSASKVKRSRNCIRILDTKFEKSTSRLKQVLHKMNTFSSITAHGMLAKDMIADLINGEWTSLAVNVGLVASGFVLSRGADELAKIAIAGKSALSYAVKLGAPFLRRLTSGFVIYDLIQNMQDTKDENFAVNIVQDSTFLLVDTVDIGLEIAETVGFTASEYLGPVGMAVGVAVWIGGDIYKTVKTLNRLDERLNLDAVQKLQIGARLFFHLNIESNIKEIELYKVKFESARKIIESHKQIIYYVTNLDPDLETVIRFNDREFEKHNYNEMELICPSNENFQPYGTFLGSIICQNALAVENKHYNEPGVVFVNVMNSSAQVLCSRHHINLITIGNGNYNIVGRDPDDIFSVSGTFIQGILDGGSGFNTLDIGQVSSDVKVDIVPGILEINSFSTNFKNIQIMRGRSKCSEFLETWPELHNIDLLGGKNYTNPDIIDINSHTRLDLVIRNFTNILFGANITGNFYVFFPDMTYFTNVKIRKNYRNASFEFNIDVESNRANLKLRKGILYFQFNKISGCLNQLCTLKFKDNLTVHTKNMISEVSTNLSFMEIMHTYEKLHVQLKSLLIVQMIQANTVIMFAHHLLHSNLTILQNDPSKMTHFFQGPEENVFVINFVSNRIPSFRDVTIHRPRHFEESFADVIDLKMLRTVQHKVSCFSHGENIIIRIWIQNWYLSKIILKNFATNVRLFEKTLLRVGNVPMKIHYNGTFALVPVPLKFNRNEKMIIVDTVDVEYGHLIYIDRRITRYHLFHIHKNDMLLTNDLFNVHNRARFLLILRNFYQNDKMRTIKLNFLERQFDMSSLEFNVEEAFDLKFLLYYFQ